MADSATIDLQVGIEIPLRDGVLLSANLYTPKGQHEAGPCIASLTPYMADHLHDRGVYFAARGLPFLAVDVRGRGNSGGVFQPHIQEAQDGYDVVTWLARQPYCNGKVGMYGGSYLGYAQWVTAAKHPVSLMTIVPTAAPYIGVDVPIRNNIASADSVHWLAIVSGHAAYPKSMSDQSFWSSKHREWFESGRSLREADAALGYPSPIFQEWLSHPEPDEYLDVRNPTAVELAWLQIPVLTITGAYDGNQPGALEHYRRHMRAASPAARTRHYLVIGPWNHAGCALPSAEFEGLKVGSESVIDMFGLHLAWYQWTMQGGPKPEFLRDRVTYYVTGAEQWRYAPTLEDVTTRLRPYYLSSTGNPADIFGTGFLEPRAPGLGEPDHYVYDPRDVSLASVESTLDSGVLRDQRMLYAAVGKELIYHSAPFDADVEISGFFKFVAWISIDQPDTDFAVRIYEIDSSGASLQLTAACLRARYRESTRTASLIRGVTPLPYEFNQFMFTARMIRKGHRLRLVFGPASSIYEEKNYNSGGVVAEESMKDARTVKVRLFHDEAHPTALYLPMGRGHVCK